MISHLSGTIIHKDTKHIVIQTAGVGYKVSVSSDTHNKIIISGTESVSVWTYLAVREDALDLYGFLTQEELKFFELLISISGIGPKTAMGILNVASIETLHLAISSGDTSHLTKVSGIGKKNADKIVLELKDKIDVLSDNSQGFISSDVDVLEALKALGYSHSESREVLKRIGKDVVDTGDKVKHALKLLGK